MTAADLKHLYEFEFLNDTVIDFKLKKILRDFIDAAGDPGPELAAKCHFFNTFFYKKLTQKQAGGGRCHEGGTQRTPKHGARAVVSSALPWMAERSNSQVCPPPAQSRRDANSAAESADRDEKAHARVRKWTKNVDIFSKERPRVEPQPRKSPGRCRAGQGRTRGVRVSE